MAHRYRPDPRAIARQRAGIQPRTVQAALEMQAAGKRAYDTSNRPRISQKTSGSQDPRYGSYRWKMLRAKVKRERPQCEGECEGYFASQYADHIIEVTDDTSDESFFDEGNIMALCARCHARKTRREAARRAGLPAPRQRPINCGVDPETGLPLGPHWWNTGK